MKQPPRTKRLINTTVNVFKDFSEIIYYKEPFEITRGPQAKSKIDLETGEIIENKRQRKFTFDDQILKIKDGCTVTSTDLELSFARSVRRAKDSFYGYGFCNSWQYFCTFTVSINDFESTDKATKYYWELFRKKLQYRFPDIKILAVPERHRKNKNLHFHALLGNCDLENLLTVAINPHTEKPITKNGKQVYNLPLWDKGFSTVVKIDDHADISTQMKTVSYFCKYLTKTDDDIYTYNQKRYYRTNNLVFKDKDYSLGSLKTIEKSFSQSDILFHKETERIVVYRIKNKPKLPDGMELITDPEILADMPF